MFVLKKYSRPIFAAAESLDQFSILLVFMLSITSLGLYSANAENNSIYFSNRAHDLAPLSNKWLVSMIMYLALIVWVADYWSASCSLSKIFAAHNKYLNKSPIADLELESVQSNKISSIYSPSWFARIASRKDLTSGVLVPVLKSFSKISIMILTNSFIPEL